GSGGVHDGPRAVSLYERACEAGDAPACAALASAHARGFHLRRDPERAEALWQKSCDGGHAPACRALAERLLAHRAPTRARAVLTGSCEAGHQDACALLGDWFFEGRPGIKRDFLAAAGAYDAGCVRDHARSCVMLGTLHEEGNGVDQSASTAVKLFTKACE